MKEKIKSMKEISRKAFVGLLILAMVFTIMPSMSLEVKAKEVPTYEEIYHMLDGVYYGQVTDGENTDNLLSFFDEGFRAGSDSDLQIPLLCDPDDFADPIEVSVSDSSDYDYKIGEYHFYRDYSSAYFKVVGDKITDICCTATDGKIYTLTAQTTPCDKDYAGIVSMLGDRIYEYESYQIKADNGAFTIIMNPDDPEDGIMSIPAECFINIHKFNNEYLVIVELGDPGAMVMHTNTAGTIITEISFLGMSFVCDDIHMHGSWDYSASGATLTAECKATGTCDLPNHKVSLSLSASNANYSGSAVEATMDKTAWEAAELTAPTIVYEAKSGSSLTSGKAVNPGKYTAKITVWGKTASVDFEITKKDGPAAPTGLTAAKPSTNGGNDGKITGVNTTMEYSIDEGKNWKAVTGTEITGLAAGKVCIRIKETDTVKAGKIATVTVPDGDATAPTESYKIPVKGDETVKISASIEDGIAKVDEISKKNITKALDDKSKTKTTKITIDLSGAKQEVTGVTLTKSTVNNLVNAIDDKSNKLNSVEISLSNATVVINEKALKAIKSQANGSDINLVVDDVAKTELNSAQQTELEKHEVATVFEAYFESNGKRIHDFKGGNVILSIDFKPAKGKSKKNYHVYYVADNGKMTLYNTRYMNGRLQFTTTHFSDYAIVYDENKANATGKTDESAAMKINAGLKVSQTGKAINITWGKAGDADGYNVYAAYCGESYKKIKSVSSATTSIKITKLNGKALNLKKNYKVYVKAYQNINGKKVEYSKSISAHVVGSKNLKYSNAKDINVSFKSLSLNKGKTKMIKAKTVLVNPARKQLSSSHASEFRYASSNPKVATVNKNGKITAKSKGSCNVYVYAKNGYAKKIAVKVK